MITNCIRIWVRNLATRLHDDDVHPVFDQWDLELGGNLPIFMEQGLSQAKRILVICTEQYVEQLNSDKGGVGFEKIILTTRVMQEVSNKLIIPVLRNGSYGQLVPAFLSNRISIDFREDDDFDACIS